MQAFWRGSFRRREELIQFISTSLSLSEKVKWLLSSRPEVDVLAKLKDLDNDTLDMSETLVELDTQRLADPVNAYINNKLANLKGKRGYDECVWTRYRTQSVSEPWTPFFG